MGGGRGAGRRRPFDVLASLWYSYCILYVAVPIHPNNSKNHPNVRHRRTRALATIRVRVFLFKSSLTPSLSLSIICHDDDQTRLDDLTLNV